MLVCAISVLYMCCDICVLWYASRYMDIWYIWQCCNSLWVIQGRTRTLVIYLLVMQGRTRTLVIYLFVILCSLLEELFSYTGCHHQKGGECWSLQIEIFWWWIIKWYRCIWSSISSIYIVFWLLIGR